MPPKSENPGAGGTARGAPIEPAGQRVDRSNTASRPVWQRSEPVDPPPVWSRVFHKRWGLGTVAAVDGCKLTVDFDAVGSKRVVDCFVRSTAGARAE